MKASSLSLLVGALCISTGWASLDLATFKPYFAKALKMYLEYNQGHLTVPQVNTIPITFPPSAGAYQLCTVSDTVFSCIFPNDKRLRKQYVPMFEAALKTDPTLAVPSGVLTLTPYGMDKYMVQYTQEGHVPFKFYFNVVSSLKDRLLQRSMLRKLIRVLQT